MLSFLGRSCTTLFPCMVQDWQWHDCGDTTLSLSSVSLMGNSLWIIVEVVTSLLIIPQYSKLKHILNDPEKGTVGTVRNWELFISLQQILWTTLLSMVGGVSTLDWYFGTPRASIVSRPLWDLAGCHTAVSLLWEVEKKIQVNKYKCRAVLMN